MDGHLLDRIARSFATRAHRRGALRALAAGLLAGWGWRFPRPVRAQPSPDLGPLPCAQDADCADADLDSCTGGACLDGLCAYFIVSCTPGHVCCGNGACCPESGQCLSDLDCAQTTDDPCAGATCEDGLCIPYILSCAPGAVCCKGACAPSCYESSGG